MFRVLFVLLLFNISIYGKETSVEILLLNNTWLKADLIESDKEGNLTIKLNKDEQLLRHRDFKLVKMPLPQEVIKAERLIKAAKPEESEKILERAAAKYNFPPLRLKIKLLQAELKTAKNDYKDVVSILSTSLENKMAMAEFEAAYYAQGFLLLGNAYNQLGSIQPAIEAYRHSFELAVPEYSALANFNMGKMLLKDNQEEGALDCFLENIVVFSPGTPGHRESLIKTIEIYRRNKDKKLKTYEKIFKKEYIK